MRRGRQLIALACGGCGLLLVAPGAALAAQTPVPSTYAAAQLSSSGAQLNGTVNPGGPGAVTYRFAYGTSPSNLNQQTPQTTGPSGTTTVPVSVTVGGLKPNTTYYFELIVRFNRVSYFGSVQSFTTLQVPTALTGAASAVIPGAAALGGQINPGGPQLVSYQFAYGTSSAHLDRTTPATAVAGGTVNSPVSASVTGLNPGTTYYFRLDASFNGQTFSGSVQSFATPQIPVVITGATTSISPSGAVVGGTVDPSGPQAVSYRVSFGTSVQNLSATTSAQRLANSSNPSSIATQLVGLQPDTTYYYRLEAIVNAQTYPGAVQSFTTRIPEPNTASTHASWITNTAATVGGQVSPNGFATSYHFDYGTGIGYGHSSPSFSAGAGSGPVPVSFTISGLLPGTIYHFRLVAQNAGGTVVGDDQLLTTSAVLLRPPRLRFHVVPRQTLQAAIRTGVLVKFTCSAACTAHFAITLAPGFGRGLRLPVTLARRDASLAGGGTGSARISFPRGLRARLRGRRQLKLSVSADAVGNQTTTTSAQLVQLTLGRR